MTSVLLMNACVSNILQTRLVKAKGSRAELSKNGERNRVGWGLSLLPACKLMCWFPVNNPIKRPPGVSTAPAWRWMSAHLVPIYAAFFFSSATCSSSSSHMSTFDYSHLMLAVIIFLVKCQARAHLEFNLFN